MSLQKSEPFNARVRADQRARFTDTVNGSVMVSVCQPYAAKRASTSSVKARSVEPSMVILLSSQK